MHEKRGSHDGTVHSNKGEENTQRGVERGRETLNHHLYQLDHTGNNGYEKDKGEKTEVDARNQTIGTEHPRLQQIIDRHCDQQHKGNGNAETKGCLHRLRNSKIRAHAEKEGKYHIVHKYGADEET